MNRLCKILLIVLIVAYVVSPADLCPGPIDDVIVIMIALASGKAKSLLKEKSSEG